MEIESSMLFVLLCNSYVCWSITLYVLIGTMCWTSLWWHQRKQQLEEEAAAAGTSSEAPLVQRTHKWHKVHECSQCNQALNCKCKIEMLTLLFIKCTLALSILYTMELIIYNCYGGIYCGKLLSIMWWNLSSIIFSFSCLLGSTLAEHITLHLT